MRHLHLRVLLVIMGIVLLTSAYSRLSTPATMSDTAKAFLASLTSEQRAKVSFQLTDDERLNWHFIPRERKGLPIKEMTHAQRHLANALLSAGLSQQGYIKATTIMSLEDVLKELERNNKGSPNRDPENYFFTVFGEPAETGTWGYRVEGHHVALNFTLVNGRIATSPNFFGANPAEVRQGPRAGLRALKREEDLGRALAASLTPEQRSVAIVSEKAYPDILTAASRKAALQGQPNGLPYDKLNSKQREMLQELVGEYAGIFPDPVAAHRMDQLKKAGNKLYFAWAGSLDKGAPHYYRVQAPAFLIEYDNTQNNANHIHSVWRDYEGDFALDLLGEHYKTSHKK
jgi:hypothetical protein